jgi:glycyl-tRNA synthetase alpha subunit
MYVDTRRHPKGNKVGWNVVRLDNIVYVVIIKVSPTTKLNVQLAPVALCASAVPGD